MPLVTLLDHMGDDLAVVNAARVSMDKESLAIGEQVKKIVPVSWKALTGELK